MIKTPKITTVKTQGQEFNKLRSRVFKYPSSQADERYFKLRMAEWLKDYDNAKRPTWNQFLMNIIHTRNNGGYTLKYCYFNDRIQRVFVDRDFEKWANEMKRQIEKLLVNINESI